MRRASMLARPLLVAALVLVAAACSDDDSDDGADATQETTGETTPDGEPVMETTTTTIEVDADAADAASEALTGDALDALRAEHEDKLDGVSDEQLAVLASFLCADEPPFFRDAIASAGIEDPPQFLIVPATEAARLACPDKLGEAEDADDADAEESEDPEDEEG